MTEILQGAVWWVLTKCDAKEALSAVAKHLIQKMAMQPQLPVQTTRVRCSGSLSYYMPACAPGVPPTHAVRPRCTHLQHVSGVADADDAVDPEAASNPRVGEKGEGHGCGVSQPCRLQDDLCTGVGREVCHTTLMRHVFICSGLVCKTAGGRVLGKGGRHGWAG